MKKLLDTNLNFVKFINTRLLVFILIMFYPTIILIAVLAENNIISDMTGLFILCTSMVLLFLSVPISYKNQRYFLTREEECLIKEHIDYLISNNYYNKVNVVCSYNNIRNKSSLDFVVFDDQTLIVHKRRKEGFNTIWDDPYIIHSCDYYSEIIENNKNKFIFNLVDKKNIYIKLPFIIYKKRNGYLANTQFRNNKDAVDNIIKLVNKFDK